VQALRRGAWHSACQQIGEGGKMTIIGNIFVFDGPHVLIAFLVALLLFGLYLGFTAED
jgi:hypothetical protein